MFCFSVGFEYPENSLSDRIHQSPPIPEYFWDIAIQLIDKALRQRGDGASPVCLVQAMVLTTFQQLVKGVRGINWRSLGTCIRIAHELRLNLIDVQRVGYTGQSSSETVSRWCRTKKYTGYGGASGKFDVFGKLLPTGQSCLRLARITLGR